MCTKEIMLFLSLQVFIWRKPPNLCSRKGALQKNTTKSLQSRLPPPFNSHISHLTGSWENHRLKSAGCDGVCYFPKGNPIWGQLIFEKKPLTFHYTGCLIEIPYIGFLESLYHWVGFHPLHTLNNQGSFSLLSWGQGRRFDGPRPLQPCHGSLERCRAAEDQCRSPWTTTSCQGRPSVPSTNPTHFQRFWRFSAAKSTSCFL